MSDTTIQKFYREINPKHLSGHLVKIDCHEIHCTTMQAFIIYSCLCNYKKARLWWRVKLTKVDTKSKLGNDIFKTSLCYHSTTTLVRICSLENSPESKFFIILHAPIPPKCHTLQKIHIRELELALRTKIICSVADEIQSKDLSMSCEIKRFGNM